MVEFVITLTCQRCKTKTELRQDTEWSNQLSHVIDYAIKNAGWERHRVHPRASINSLLCPTCLNELAAWLSNDPAGAIETAVVG